MNNATSNGEIHLFRSYFMKQTLKQELLEMEKQVQPSKDVNASLDGSSNLLRATITDLFNYAFSNQLMVYEFISNLLFCIL